MSDAHPSPTNSTIDFPPPARPAERFAPGTLLAGGRYRVVVPLGKGAMGEVYRADDLKLGQSVALKFLAPHLAADAARLERLHNEVKNARQVSHPNVCRVHDVAEHEGQPFLVMEFIDGEDLAALLRRIGRLAEDRAARVAAQLCLALAAVHARKLVHRDLKPANVMLDREGEVRLSDFGLADFAEHLGGGDRLVGTPAYMAPEQLAGSPASERSDLFALGLVLYEVFTGKKAFAARGLDELKRRHEGGPPAPPSSHVSGLGAAVDGAVLRCLECDPAQRPGDASEVALAVGATPSPRDDIIPRPVAGSLRPRAGLTLLGLALAAMVLVAWLNDQVKLFRQVPQKESPRGLSEKASVLLEKLGFDNKPGDDSAYGLTQDRLLLRYLAASPEGTPGRDRLRTGQPAPLYFWYRQGPGPLVQRLAPADTVGWSMPGRVRPNEPPLREAGMACVFLDLKGRLLELHAVPQRGAAESAPPEGWWKPLLEFAGLKEKFLTRLERSQCVPPVFATARIAWRGHYPDRPELPVQVEAAWGAAGPVYFHVGPPGLRERLYTGFEPDDEPWLARETIYTALGLIAVPIGGWLAWRNWRLGRANPRGARRLIGCCVVLGLAGWLLAAKHVLSPADEVAMFAAMLGRMLVDGLFLWLAYMALEPWVRRRPGWPGRVVAWNRALEGAWRDPLVGRELLLGVLVGSAFALIQQVFRAWPVWLGWPPDYNSNAIWEPVLTEGAGTILLTAQYFQITLRDFFLFFLLLWLARWDWLGVALALLIWTIPWLPGREYWWAEALTGLSFAALGLLLLYRAGLLAFVVYHFTANVLDWMPVTVDLSAWYAGISTVSLLTLAGLAAYGFWAACRDRLLSSA